MAKKQSILRWEVLGQESGLKLIDFLRKKVEASSNRELKRKIEANLCRINDKPERFASTILRKGDLVTFFDEELAKSPDLAFDDKRVLFEDSHLLIYNKPVGFTCDPKYLEAFRNDLFLTHRLDKETTGVLILAKSKNSAEKMQNIFMNREVHKTYLALVDKVVRRDSGTIENYLGKLQSYHGNSIHGSVGRGVGQLAITKWQVKERGKKASLLIANPITGRTHQLRVHFAEMGHPILGDFVYGQDFACDYRPARALLHAYQIQFTHPVTQENMEVIAPLPFDFMEAKKVLIP